MWSGWGAQTGCILGCGAVTRSPWARCSPWWASRRRCGPLGRWATGTTAAVTSRQPIGSSPRRLARIAGSRTRCIRLVICRSTAWRSPQRRRSDSSARCSTRLPFSRSITWSRSRTSSGGANRDPSPWSGLYLVPPALLRSIQRPVSRLDHLIPLGVALVLLRDADADGHRDALPGATVGQHLLLLLLRAEPGAQDEARVPDRLAQRFQIGQAFLGAPSGEDPRELLAAIAVGQIGR